MTTRYMKTTGIPLYKHGDDTYCKMIDVLNLIHHEYFETQDEKIRDILDRMEMRLCKNDFLLPDVEKPMPIGAEQKPRQMPGRYAVGKEENGKWTFYMGSCENSNALFTQQPCKAFLYKTYRDASACADFLDEDGEWLVLDWSENLSEEQRWQRDLFMPFPYDADEGNIDSIPVLISH